MRSSFWYVVHKFVGIQSRMSIRDKWVTLIVFSFPLEKQIDLSAVDLKKLKVRDLKKILNDWDETCDGCIEKTDYIRRIEELKPKYYKETTTKQEL